MKIKTKFSNNLNAFPISFDENSTEFSTEFKNATVVEIVTSDHDKLVNRDKEKQHPIKSIDGLQLQLGGKVNSEDALTNFEILDIINS